VSSFAYRRPASADALWDVLDESEGEVALLAGGTDLVVGLNKGTVRPATVVDLKRVDVLRAEIELVDGGLRVGALAVLSDLIADTRVREHFAALVEAAAVVGSIQIRNRATMVGNVCNASPAADTAPALLVYEASVNLLAREAERSLPLADFFTGPGTTALRSGEIVASIDLPLPPRPHGSAFVRVARRRGFDLGTVSVACLLAPGRPARFGFGAVAARPLLAVSPTDALDDTGLERVLAETSPISDVRASRDYRLAMLHTLTRRALAVAALRLEESG
jgi:CO/xanthine dehydrogenase FAD-binding subunit